MRSFTKALYLFFAITILSTATAFASGGKLTGKVIDAKSGEPIV